MNCSCLWILFWLWLTVSPVQLWVPEKVILDLRWAQLSAMNLEFKSSKPWISNSWLMVMVRFLLHLCCLVSRVHFVWYLNKKALHYYSPLYWAGLRSWGRIRVQRIISSQRNMVDTNMALQRGSHPFPQNLWIWDDMEEKIKITDGIKVSNQLIYFFF